MINWLIQWLDDREVRRVMKAVDRYGYAPYPVPPGHPAWCALSKRLGRLPGLIPGGMDDASPEHQAQFKRYCDDLQRAYCG